MSETGRNEADISAVETMDTLNAGCAQLGIALSSDQLDMFRLFANELAEWNQKFNLTTITDTEEVQVKHFLDSLVSLPLIAEELETTIPIQRGLHVVDVGTGAGFPGLPLKIVCPRFKLTLIDGTGKKIRFLSQLVKKLNLNNVEIVQGRAEELARQSRFRGQFDLVVARAVAPLNTLAEYILPLTRRDGLAVVYKGANATEEFSNAQNAIAQLGGETVRFVPVKVPNLNQKRFILIIQKIKRTPERFPRGQGLARKRPL